MRAAAMPLAALAALELLFAAGAAADPGLAIAYVIRSDGITESVALAHSGDSTHFCAVGAYPFDHARANGQTVEVPPGPPTLEIDYDATAAPPAQSVRLSIFGYRPGMTSSNDAADDWVELNANGKRWIGHRLGATPPFMVDFAIAPDGRSGSFDAANLHASDDPLNGNTISVSGTWRCEE